MKPSVLLDFLITSSMWGFRDSLSFIKTPRYFALFVWVRLLPRIKYLVIMCFFFSHGHSHPVNASIIRGDFGHPNSN